MGSSSKNRESKSKKRDKRSRSRSKERKSRKRRHRSPSSSTSETIISKQNFRGSPDEDNCSPANRNAANVGTSKKKKSKKRKHRRRSPYPSPEPAPPRSSVPARYKSMIDPDDGEDSEEEPAEHLEADVDRKPPVQPAVKADGEGNVLSIAETNRLRTKLGLKPLTIGGSGGGGDDAGTAATTKEDVHVPAVNRGQLAQQQKLRDKLDSRREKRKIDEKLAKVKRLADKSSDEDDAYAWVKKSRKEERKQARIAAVRLEQKELEDQFGIDRIVDDENRPKYDSKNLKGLSVEHSMDRFREGHTTILTLKDKNVLDSDDEDVLVNVNIQEQERTDTNVDLRKKKPAYNPYDVKLDEFGMPMMPSILSKYDEEIDGRASQSFRLGNRGLADGSSSQAVRGMKADHVSKAISLAGSSLKLASEFFTAEEMVAFKRPKPKKLRRVRKHVVKAEDLIPQDETGDHGSRAPQIPGLDIKAEEVYEREVCGPTDGWAAYSVKDEDTSQEQSALQRKHRLVHRDLSDGFGAEAVVTRLVETRNNLPFAKGSILLDATSEFCRTVGENEEDVLAKRIDESVEENDEEVDQLEPDDIIKNTSIMSFLTREPVLNCGIAGALSLAGKKGYLEETFKRATTKKSVLTATSRSVVAPGTDFDDKFAKQERWSRGPLQDFAEKKSYVPDVRIEYADDHGRNLDEKEAFRYLSHKFHGKGSGKVKYEKHNKKLQELEYKLKMSSTDTPLNTVAIMTKKQEQLSMPYVILTGTNNTFITNPLSKDTVSKR